MATERKRQDVGEQTPEHAQCFRALHDVGVLTLRCPLSSLRRPKALHFRPLIPGEPANYLPRRTYAALTCRSSHANPPADRRHSFTGARDASYALFDPAESSRQCGSTLSPAQLTASAPPAYASPTHFMRMTSRIIQRQSKKPLDSRTFPPTAPLRLSGSP